MPREYTISLDIPARHPAFADHFPDNPVVPGALLLSWVARAATDATNHGEIARISSAKFIAITRPGDSCTLTLTESKLPHHLQFFCRRADNETLLKGTLEFAG